MITAVIPVRRDSQRVKDKNLRPFANTTLLDIKIRSLLKVDEIDRIVVNTNSPIAMEKVVKEYGDTKVEIHQREEYYASSECSGSDFFEHLGKVTETDVFVYAPPTSPFVREDTIRRCINLYNSCKGEYDCVSTVSRVKQFLWFNEKPINYNLHNAPNSQDLPDVVALNFGITIIDREKLISNRNIIGDRPKFYMTSEVEGIDIDTPLDFLQAEYLYKRLSQDQVDIYNLISES